MKAQLFTLSMLIISLPACTWVEATREGSEVTLVKSFNVKNCKKLSTVVATVKHKVGIIKRDNDTVKEELITVARNRAAELGGDSIVAQQPAIDGAMSFDVFRCGE